MQGDAAGEQVSRHSDASKRVENRDQNSFSWQKSVSVVPRGSTPEIEIRELVKCGGIIEKDGTLGKTIQPGRGV